jgi:LysM repeat protein
MLRTSRNRTLMLMLLAALLLAAVSLPLVSAQETYVVRYGDVLDLIAARYNVSAACIAEASGLANPNRLRPGDTLAIPANCPPYDGLALVAQQRPQDDAGQGGGGGATVRTPRELTQGNIYVVRRGDVLDLIGAAFDVSPTCIARTNDLAQPNRIFPGDELVIDVNNCPPYDGVAFVLPQVPPGQGGGAAVSRPPGSTYIVAAGDVLDLIAAYFNVSTRCVAEGNGLTGVYRIFPGDELVIPANCPPYDGTSTFGRVRNLRSAGAGAGGGTTTTAPAAQPTAQPTVAPPVPLPTTAPLELTPEVLPDDEDDGGAAG